MSINSKTQKQTAATAAEPEHDGQSPGPSKKVRPSLFGYCKKIAYSAQETDSQKHERVMLQYIEAINNETFVADDNNPLYTNRPVAGRGGSRGPDPPVHGKNHPHKSHKFEEFC